MRNESPRRETSGGSCLRALHAPGAAPVQQAMGLIGEHSAGSETGEGEPGSILPAERPSTWESGEIRLDWGHAVKGPRRGRLESYNAEIVSLHPIQAAQLQGTDGWTSDMGQKASVAVSLLYARGMDVDRSMLTVRSDDGACSFLPGEAVEGEPIDIVDYLGEHPKTGHT